MVIPLRTDTHGANESAVGQRPILLAQLPRIGEAVAQPVAKPSMAVVPEEPVVVTPPAVEKSKLSYFVDSGHTKSADGLSSSVESTVEAEVTTEASTKGKRKRLSRTRSSSSSNVKKHSSSGVSQSFTWSAFYCKLHNQMAPFAGAIVALALVSSASLMYWMILAPTPPKFEYNEMANDEFGEPEFEIPPFAPRSTPIPVPDSTSEAAPLLDERETLAETKPDEVLAQPEEVVSEPVFVAKQTVVQQEVPATVKATEQTEAPKQELSQIAIGESQPTVTTPASTESSVATVEPAAKQNDEAPKPTVLAEGVYPSTTHTAPLDFSQVFSAGKGGLLSRDTQQVQPVSNVGQAAVAVYPSQAGMVQQPMAPNGTPAVANRPAANVFTTPRR